MSLKAVAERLAYKNRASEYDILLERCCLIQPSGTIFLDEYTFTKDRFGFDPSQVEYSANMIDHVRRLQRAARRFLLQLHHAKYSTKPGYARATGVFKSCGIQLVYLLTASRDQKEATLLVHYRDEEGKR